MSFAFNSVFGTVHPTVCYIHPRILDPVHCQTCFDIQFGAQTQRQGMDKANSDYPDIDRIQAQGPYNIPPPSNTLYQSQVPAYHIPSHVPARRVPVCAALPFPETARGVFQPIVVPESAVKHDHYSDRLALSPSERDHFPKEHYSDRFALSSDEEGESEKVEKAGKVRKMRKVEEKPRRTLKIRKIKRATTAKEPVIELPEVEEVPEVPKEPKIRRSQRRRKKVNYTGLDEDSEETDEDVYMERD